MSSINKKDLSFAAVATVDEAPIDSKNLAYIIMFYEGVGNLFPWNAFITAASYFAVRFCGSMFGDNFENYFSFSYTLSQTIGLALSIKFQNSLSLRTKIIYPLIVYSLSFLVTTILVTVKTEANLLFGVTLFQTALCGICGAILSGGLFGLGAMFPPAYTGALMSGQGLAGLIVSVANVLTLLASSRKDDCSDDTSTECADFSVDYSALAYFVIATVILGFCGVAFLLLQNLDFTRYYLTRSEMSSASEPLLAGQSERLENSESMNPIIGNEDSMLINSVSNNDGEKQLSGHVSMSHIWRVYKLVLIPALSVTATFTITIGLFPSLTVFMESQNKCKNDSRFSNDLFIPIMFLLFNLFDLVGRLTAGAFKPLFTVGKLWIPASLRLVFFPLFLLCRVSNSQLPLVFANDFFPLFFMVCFAFTNGYVASLCMMLGPSLAPAKDASLAGTIMIFSLTVGLLCGACTSFITVIVSQGSV